MGKGCIVAAKGLVIKDVAPFNLVGGVPAKVIKPLDSPEEPRDQGDNSDSIVSGNSGNTGVEKVEGFCQEVNSSGEGLPGDYNIEEIDKSERTYQDG